MRTIIVKEVKDDSESCDCGCLAQYHARFDDGRDIGPICQQQYDLLSGIFDITHENLPLDQQRSSL